MSKYYYKSSLLVDKEDNEIKDVGRLNIYDKENDKVYNVNKGYNKPINDNDVLNPYPIYYDEVVYTPPKTTYPMPKEPVSTTGSLPMPSTAKRELTKPFKSIDDMTATELKNYIDQNKVNFDFVDKRYGQLNQLLRHKQQLEEYKKWKNNSYSNIWDSKKSIGEKIKETIEHTAEAPEELGFTHKMIESARSAVTGGNYIPDERGVNTGNKAVDKAANFGAELVGMGAGFKMPQGMNGESLSSSLNKSISKPIEKTVLNKAGKTGIEELSKLGQFGLGAAQSAGEFGALSGVQTATQGGENEDILKSVAKGALSGALWHTGSTAFNKVFGKVATKAIKTDAGRKANIMYLKRKGYNEVKPDSGVWKNKKNDLFVETVDIDGQEVPKFMTYKEKTSSTGNETKDYTYSYKPEYIKQLEGSTLDNTKLPKYSNSAIDNVKNVQSRGLTNPVIHEAKKYNAVADTLENMKHSNPFMEDIAKRVAQHDRKISENIMQLPEAQPPKEAPVNNLGTNNIPLYMEDTTQPISNDFKALKDQEVSLQGKNKKVETEPKILENSIEPTVQEAVNNTVTINPKEISVDPKRFQFKSEVNNETGTGKLLKNVNKWDDNLAGRVLIWEDRTGNRYVVNGHHRLELANRLGVNNIDAKILKEVDGISNKDAREIGAKVNIAEGRGTATDAAKVFREGGYSIEDLKESGLSLSEGKVKDGYSLAQLNDRLFNKIISKQLTEKQGSLIGEAFPKTNAENEAMQNSAYDYLEKHNFDVTTRKLKEVLDGIKGTDVSSQQQMTLMGMETIWNSNFDTKADLISGIKHKMSVDKNLFKNLSNKQKSKIAEAAGNKLNSEANAKNKQITEISLEMLDKDKWHTSTPIGKVVENYTSSITAGMKKNIAADKAYNEIKAIIGKGDFLKAEEPKNTQLEGQINLLGGMGNEESGQIETGTEDTRRGQSLQESEAREEPKEGVKSEEIENEGTELKTIPSEEMLKNAKSIVGNKFEINHKHTNKYLHNYSGGYLKTNIPGKTIHVVDYVADENLKQAPTDKIKRAIVKHEKVLKAAYNERVDAVNSSGGTAAIRGNFDSRVSSHEGTIDLDNEAIKRLKGELERRKKTETIINTDDKSNELPTLEKKIINDKDHMTIERVDQEPFVVKRGVIVDYSINKQRYHGKVVGISHAKNQIKIKSLDHPNSEGIWFEKSFIYPSIYKMQNGEKLSNLVKNINKKNQPKGGFSENDRVLTKQEKKEKSKQVLKQISDFNSKFSKGENTTLNEVKEHTQYIINNEKEIKESLSQLKNTELKKMISPIYRDRYTKKADMVDHIYESQLSNTTMDLTGEITISYGLGKPVSEQFKDKLNSAIQNLDETKLNELLSDNKKAYNERQIKIQKKKESIKNPQNLEDFNFAKKLRKLTTEEQRTYEELKAKNLNVKAKQKSEEKRTNSIEAISNIDSLFKEPIKDKHTKTGENLWVVKFKDRVDKDTYKSINSEVKKLGGYYSKYKRGFVFKEEPTEKLRILKEGGSFTKKAMDNSKAIADKLRKVAENMQKTIDEKYTDKLENTARRASMAANARAEGDALKETQNIMKRIADTIEKGEAEHLKGISAKTHVETLEYLLNRSKRDYIEKFVKEKYPNDTWEQQKYREELSKKETPIDAIDIAQYPKMSIYSNNLNNLIEFTKNLKGCKRLSTKYTKLVEKNIGEHININGNQLKEIESLIKVAKKHNIKNYDIPTINFADDYKRLNNMGISTVEQLRAALREFLPHTKGAGASAEELKQREIKSKELELARHKIEGYFPTPKKIIKRMLDEANIKPGEHILEPSAGAGHIADEIKNNYDNNLDVIEYNSSLNDLLSQKGHNVVDDNFLEHKGQYDKIIMNPPFEKGQDVDHIKHAYENLKPDGRIVAIMSEHPFFASDKKSIEFRRWINLHGTSEKLEDGAFKESDRKTGVNTRLVIIDKSKHEKGLPTLGKKEEIPNNEMVKLKGTEKQIAWAEKIRENFKKEAEKEIEHWEKRCAKRGTKLPKRIIELKETLKKYLKITDTSKIIELRYVSYYDMGDIFKIDKKNNLPTLDELNFEIKHYKNLQKKADNIADKETKESLLIGAKAAKNIALDTAKRLNINIDKNTLELPTVNLQRFAKKRKGIKINLGMIKEQAEHNTLVEDYKKAHPGEEIKKKKRKHAETYKNAEATAKKVKQGLEEKSTTYIPITNKVIWEKAKTYVDENYIKAKNRIMRTDSMKNADDTAIAEAILFKMQNEAKVYKEAGNDEMAEAKYNEAVEWAAKVSEKLTKSGQAVQAASMWNRLSPEGVLTNATKKINKYIADNVPKEKMNKLNTQTKAINTSMNELNKEATPQAIQEIFDLPEIRDIMRKAVEKQLGEKNKKETTPAEQLANKVKVHMSEPKENTKDAVKEMVNALYQVAKETLPEKRSIKSNPVDVFVEAVANKAKYKGTWFKALNVVKNKFKDDPDSLIALDDYFSQFNSETFKPYSNKQMNKAISATIKDLNINLNSLIKKHDSNVVVQTDKIVNMLMRKNYSKEAAAQAAKDIGQRVAQLVKEKRELTVDNMLKVKTKAEPKPARQVLNELYNLGVFDRYLDSPDAVNKKLNNIALKRLKELEINLTDIVKQNYSTQNSVGSILKNSLMQSGMDIENAEVMSELIKGTYDRITRNKKAQILNNMFKDRPSPKQKKFIDKIIELSNLGAFEGDYKNAIAKKLKIPQLTSETANKIMTMSEKLQEMQFKENKTDKDKRAERILRNQLEDYIDQQIPSTFLRKLNTYQIMNLLVNTKTATRNIGGNTLATGETAIKDIVGTAIDKGISTFTGKRTTVLPNPLIQAKGYKKGLKDTYLDFIQNVNSKESNDKLELSHQRTFRKGILRQGERAMNFLMDDRPFKTAVFEDSIRKQKKLAKLNGKKFDETKAIEQANEDSAIATFNDKNKISDASVKIQKALNLGKEWGLGSILHRFARTPVNILKFEVEYTPYSIFKGVIKAGIDASKGNKFNQKAFVNNMAKGLTGLGIMYLGGILNKLGLISLDRDKNKNKAALDRDVGKGDFRFNITGLERIMHGKSPKMQKGDLLISFNWAVPFAPGITAGAAWQEAKSKTDDNKAIKATETYFRSIGKSVDSIVELPMLQSLKTITQGDSLAEGVGKVVSSVPQTLVPFVSTLNQTKQIKDNKTRETYDPTAFGTITNQIKNRLPGLSETLPQRVDVLGRNKETYQNSSNTLANVMINPAYVTRYLPTKQAEMAYDIYEKTGSKLHLPKVVSKTIDAGENGKIKLTTKEYTEYQRKLALATKEIYKNNLEKIEDTYVYAKHTKAISKDYKKFRTVKLGKKNYIIYVTDSEKISNCIASDISKANSEIKNEILENRGIR